MTEDLFESEIAQSILQQMITDPYLGSACERTAGKNGYSIIYLARRFLFYCQKLRKGFSSFCGNYANGRIRAWVNVQKDQKAWGLFISWWNASTLSCTSHPFHLLRRRRCSFASRGSTRCGFAISIIVSSCTEIFRFMKASYLDVKVKDMIPAPLDIIPGQTVSHPVPQRNATPISAKMRICLSNNAPCALFSSLEIGQNAQRNEIVLPHAGTQVTEDEQVFNFIALMYGSGIKKI